MRQPKPRIRRTGRGDFEIRLPREERDLLRSIPGELREALQVREDPAVARLFPPAHPDDPERNDEYAELVGDDLVAGRLRAVEVLEATVDAKRLDEEQMAAWLGVINDVRLILGTRLDVDEDLDLGSISPEHPLAPAYAVYGYLGWLQEQVVLAMAAGLPSRPSD
jgi:Domain of unknown function (DUF2017)